MKVSLEDVRMPRRWLREFFAEARVSGIYYLASIQKSTLLGTINARWICCFIRWKKCLDSHPAHHNKKRAKCLLSHSASEFFYPLSNFLRVNKFIWDNAAAVKFSCNLARADSKRLSWNSNCVNLSSIGNWLINFYHRKRLAFRCVINRLWSPVSCLYENFVF